MYETGKNISHNSRLPDHLTTVLFYIKLNGSVKRIVIVL